MDFESPDVEKDFPGLFASESVKKGNESDFSDENHDKSYKKELISGKKKDKRDSKKDRGYAALEGESSADENADSKSPSKSKKSKSFKFPTKKSEKREKSREKDGKEKEPEKDKKKEKDKKEKDKAKLKDKKKNRHSEDLSEWNGDYPIFGVDLETAVERSGCLDGIPIPLIIRNCIDCIHNYGLSLEGLYKTVGVKSKVLATKRAYNLREPVFLTDHDVFVSTCLLKMFLRELPEPLLTHDLLARFEEAGAIMEVDARELELQKLIQQLPYHNKILLSWLIIHFDTVTMHEKQNKLNAQSIATVFSPVLQMSHRLLTAFLCHCKALFPDIVIKQYVPPLCAGSPLPEKSEEIVSELQKQESLLNQIHKEMSQGFVSKKREEQLWEVQRIVTQLKRTLRSIQKSQESNALQRSMDEEQAAYEEPIVDEPKKQSQHKQDFQKNVEELKEESSESRRTTNELDKSSKESEDEITVFSSESNTQKEIPKHEVKNLKLCQGENSPKQYNFNSLNERMRNDHSLEFLRLQLEREQLSKFQSLLEERLESERRLIERLQSEIRACSETDLPHDVNGDEDSSETHNEIAQLLEENNVLMKKKDELVRTIFEERIACLNLKVYINLLELNGKAQTYA